MLLLLVQLPAFALTPAQALRIAQGESDDRIAALAEAVASADPALATYVQALLADEVKVANGKAYVTSNGKVVEAGSGVQVAALPDGAEDVINPNRVRRELEAALAALRLFSADRAERAKAVMDLKDQVSESQLPLLEKAEADETDADIRGQIAMLKAAVLISSTDKARRLAAAQLLADST
ncbi:MAG TPA: urea ABC transporter permease subunit UrtB, partial [Rubrivivax sp.]|nr:urea ABC transporter permease subunit UrtB [Rubrivivax sp.]